MKGRSKRNHLNKFISQKCNSKPTVLFCFWKTFYQYYSYTKLRYKCILHCDHYKSIITNTPFCSCGQNEDEYHFFFFACKKYSKARNNMFNQLFMLDLVNINTNLLLCGDVHLPLQTNLNIFFSCSSIYGGIY